MDGVERAFELQVGPYSDGELRVVRFVGSEALSRPFAFDVDVVASGEDPIDASAVLGADALLSVHSPGGERLVHGMVSRVVADGVAAGRPRYRIRIVPRLWRLGLSLCSRSFTGLDAVAIVKKVLAEHGVAARLALASAYPVRELCVQYRESDLAFVARLLEAEGITYSFEHHTDRHVLVLADSAEAPAPIDGDATLPMRERGAVTDRDHVFAFEHARGLRTGAVVVGGFDFVRPALDLKTGVRGGDEADLEDYDHDIEHAAAGDGKRMARRRLEAHRAQAQLVGGASVCARLVPGATFELEEHTILACNRRYLVVEVEHRGAEPELLAHPDGEPAAPAYENHFRCLPADVPFRPRATTRRPVIPGVQTATVVGPPGEDIHTDEHGRVLVHFHWDRDTSAASCWLRVSQAWAGAGWGALYLPRVGMEVIVRFLDGHPDRPIVVGCAYNGANPPPVSLPAEKTKSVLRSASSVGSSGHNELTFEDAAGAEQIFVHAQRDEDIVVENDKQQAVDGGERLAVGKDRKRDVAGKQELHVGGDDGTRVDGGQRLSVRRDRTVVVGGNHHEDIGGGASEKIVLARAHEVAHGSAENVLLAKALSIGGAYAVDVGLVSMVNVGQLRSVNVGAFAKERVSGSRAESVDGDRECRVMIGGRDDVVDHDYTRTVAKNEAITTGESFLSVAEKPAVVQSKKIEITADELGLTMNGEIVLLINKAGTIKLFGKTIEIEGESAVAFQAKKIHKLGGGSGAKKKAADVLDASEAEDGRYAAGQNKYLSARDAKAFKNSEYRVRVLKKDMVCYRLHGDGARPLGKWVGKTRPPTGLEGKLRCALDPTWGNGATKVSKVLVPAGTRVFEGAYAAQGAYASKGIQLCVAVPRQLERAAVTEYLTALGVRVIP